MNVPKELAFSAGEYRRRVRLAQSRLRQRGLDAIVLFGPHNIHYLTGMDSENLFDPQACILTADADPVLVILDFELGRFENSAWLAKPVLYGSFDDPVTAFAGAIDAAGLSRGRIGVEQRAINAQQSEQLGRLLPGVLLEDGFGIVEPVRLVKSAEEIALIRRAAAMTDKAVAAGFAAISDGHRDYEVAAAITAALYDGGSHLPCWGPIVASGYRSGLAHSAHNGRVMRTGDVVFLELTGQHQRYTAPLMRSAVIGRASAEQRRIADASAAAVEAILGTARPGIEAREVAEAGLAPIAPVESSVVFHHNFGYPVGLGYPPSWIEMLGFFLRADNPAPLQPGMVFHLPMSLRVAGTFGVCLSHTMLVTETGAETLTRSPAKLIQI